MERAGRLIPKLKLSLQIADSETRAKGAWALAAGPKIARHTEAVSLVRGKLIVQVADFTWQRQLATLEHFLLRNLRDALGEALVEGIDFRPMPAHMRNMERRMPQMAETSRPTGDITERIDDPVLAWNYRQSKAKA
jgi:predicted nucleic acid-binding Zn ribbon protein